MELLRKIKDRAPEYNESLEDIISRFTVKQGGRAGTAAESTTWEEGKFFATKYEIYMYAALLGLKNDYKLPISNNAKKTKFIEIKSWQPQDIADYIIMGIIAKSDIDLNDIEEKEDDEVEKEILKLRKLMEEYANGGFDMIRSKLEQDPSFFDNNENCFIDLLEDKIC